MSGPQLEDGFTRIAHEILDAICQYNFNGAQLRIILKVWRMTYGYSRKDHDFSLTFLHETTKLSERTVKKEVAALVKQKVLTVTKEATKTTARKLAFNKNYDEWHIQRGGESKIQPDLFGEYEGHDCSPPNSYSEGNDCSPHEGHDCSPQSNDFSYSEGHDRSPINRNKRSLKKLYIERENTVFETFYHSYPRRVSKAAALKAWNKLSKEKDFDPERIIRYTENFAATCKLLQTETRFIPHPSTFLNQRRYEDYKLVDPEGLAQQKKSKSKFERNKALLLGDGGETDDGAGSQVPTFQSFGSLPEPD